LSVDDELAFELVVWLDCVDVFELLDDLQPKKKKKKRMKAIACARRCGLMFELLKSDFEGALFSLLTHFLSIKTSVSIVAALLTKVCTT